MRISRYLAPRLSRTWAARPGRPARVGHAGRPERSRLFGAGRAFTLAEVVVSVGILAVVAAALAAVFAAVGDTVSSGRRVNRLNSFASQFMQVLRTDIEERMRTPGNSRDGAVLVIRHEFANNREDVDLLLGDEDPRPRRIDQLLFLVGGEFRTQRPGLVRELGAASSTSAIAYYGHGSMQEPPALGDDGSDPFFLPRVWDINATSVSRQNGSASLGDEGVTYAHGDTGIFNPDLNPNRYASDWLLVRHLTLLVQPGGLTDLPNQLAAQLPYGLDTDNLRDSPVQHRGQPAAWSPFSTLARSRVIDPLWDPANPATFDPQGVSTNAFENRTPVVESGLVDIAYGSPATIDAFIRSAHLRPFDDQLLGASRQNVSEQFYEQSRNPLASISVTPQVYGASLFGYVPGMRSYSREIMQGWMLDLMPGEHFAEESDERTRIRVEREPPRTIFPDDDLTAGPQLGAARGLIADDGQAGLVRAVLGADQQMVSGGTWVPRCTEFIVEWSYGQIDRDPASPTSGQVIWYGLPRWDDRDANGSKDPGEPWVAGRYLNNFGQTRAEYLPEYTSRLPLTNLIMPGAEEFTEAVDRSPDLLLERGWRNSTVDGRRAFFDQQNATSDEDLRYATSFFFTGLDPMYWEGTTRDPDTDGVFEFVSSNPGARWVWPTMLRVTATFADPEQPDVETTIQSVFRVPGEGVQ